MLQNATVPKQTSTPKRCTFCMRPITAEQRPAVQLPNGDEIHAACWAKYEEARQKKKVN